jgi:hypothetical protein
MKVVNIIKDIILIASLVWVSLFYVQHGYGQQVELGEPQAIGTGCPSGSVSAALSPGNSAVSILFDSFLIEHPKGSTRPTTKGCRFIVPISVERGFKVQAATITYRGYISLPKKAHATIYTNNLFRHPRFGQPMTTQTVFQNGSENIDQDYVIQQSSNQAPAKGCVSQTQLDFTTQVTVNYSIGRFATPMPEDGLFTLDSVDLSASPIEIGLQVVRCN